MVRAIKKIPVTYTLRMKDRERLLGDKVDGERAGEREGEREREREMGDERDAHWQCTHTACEMPTQFREEDISQEVVVRLLSNALQRGM